MVDNIDIYKWGSFLQTEYLSNFIKNGGGSIKFSVPVIEDNRQNVINHLQSIAKDGGYVSIAIDGNETPLHMPQNIFFGMSKQIDWREVARKFILKLAQEHGYTTNEIDLTSSENIFSAIAQPSGLDPSFVYQAIIKDIQDQIFFNTNMCIEFRTAMSQLCVQERNAGQFEAYNGQAIIDWLNGEVTRITSVKTFGIYNGINRTSARYFIESAVYWLSYVGYAGTILLLDNSRVTLKRNPKDGLKFYNKAMRMDHYELLRQFIDRIDSLRSTLIIVIPHLDFLDPDPTGTGFGTYQALQTRVMDEVRDKDLPNPLASLVRLQ